MKRAAPLRRNQGLRAAAPLRRHRMQQEAVTGIAYSPKPRKPRKPTGFPPTVRAAIRRRAQDCCEACGVHVGPNGGNIQHIHARKMGGRRDPVYNSAVNGALLCGTPQSLCHGACESRDEAMYSNGFWRKEGERPGEVPILWHGKFHRWLTPDGGYSSHPPEAQEAA